MNKRILFLLLILLFNLSIGYSNTFFEQYNFITDKLGIPQCLVKDIIKDSDGFIWIATHEGIGRYDGYEFLKISTETVQLSLKNNNVQKIYEDNFKRLWIASEGGIDILDLKSYNFVDINRINDPFIEELLKEAINTLFVDSYGSIWIATQTKLHCLDFNKQGELNSYYTLKSESTVSINEITEMNDTICVGINNEVCSVQKTENSQLIASLLSSSIKSYSEDWRILCMKVDNEFLWIGSNRGLFRYHSPTGELKRYRYSTHREGMLSQAYITDIQLTKQGHLIVSTLNGLNIYHKETDTFSFIRQSNNRDTSKINCNAINCLFVDNETIWIGTESGGVNLLSPKRLHATLWNHRLCGLPIEPNIPVNAVTEDKEGNLWVSFIERGLVKWESNNNSFQHHLFLPNNLNSISNNTVNGLLVDSENHLWSYTWGVDINELDLNNPAATFKRHTRDLNPALESDFISSACEDVTNKGIWFGSTRGVMFYSKESKKFTKVKFYNPEDEFDAIHALFIDSKNRLWIGTTQGLYIINISSFINSPNNLEYTYLKDKLNNLSLLQLEKISSILQDHQGRIWIGSISSGLYLLIEEDNNEFRFKNYTTNDGLPNNTIYGMTKDKSGYIWVATGNGLARLDTHFMAFTNYTETEGLPSTQFYWNGIYYSERKNLIYLPTSDGLVMINPTSENIPPTNALVTISSINVDGNKIHLFTNKSKIDSDSFKIKLHEQDNRFIFSFTTLNYANSNRIRYAYRLKGYENEWDETQPGNNEAKYINVPAGLYTLQVRATDELGRWSENFTEVKIEVTPYFYKTRWFYFLLMILVIVGIWIYYHFKMKRYHKQNALLEKKVEQRTLELAERNEQLEEMAEHLKEVTDEKLTFFTNITHELRTPVTLIHGPIVHALKKVQDKEIRMQLEIAERNSNYLLELVNELMDFRKLDMDRVVLDKSPINLIELISDLLFPFQLFAKERQIEIRLLHRITPSCIELDAAYIRKAMVNLISNAIKFTPDNGRIDIFIASIKNEVNKSLLYINVYDTGHGINEKEVEKIFDRFYQSKHSIKYTVNGHSGTGIGLSLCKKVVDLHEGIIYARNNPSRGASIRILLPFTTTSINYDQPVLVTKQKKQDNYINNIGEQKRDTLLIVEDNRDMRTYIHSILSAEYNLLEAENGEEALQILQRSSIDLIVSDLMMPRMDGMELSRRVKEDFSTSHIPFLMLTAVRSEVQEKKSFQLGVDEYLYKPFDEEMLLLRIRNILELRNKYKKVFSTSSKIDELQVKEESRDHLFMKRAIELMNQYYHDSNYNLECFVRDMGYSKTLVNKKMQDLTGQPIGQFMKNYRLNVAQKMIMENIKNINVSEIAYAVGYNDPKYFTRCFKELFGYLPSEKIKKT